MGRIEAYLKEVCTGTAVYWGTPTVTAKGTYTYAAPVEIACRWVNQAELITDNDGKEIMTNAKVYVTQDLDELCMLYHGNLADLSAEQQSDPRKVRRAYEIKKFSKMPSLRGGDFIRVAFTSQKLATRFT